MLDRDLALGVGAGEELPGEARYSSLSLIYLLRSFGSFLASSGCPPWWRPSRDYLLCRRVGYVICHRLYIYEDFGLSVSFMNLFIETGILSPVEFSMRLLHMNSIGGRSQPLVVRTIRHFSRVCDIFHLEVHPHTLM